MIARHPIAWAIAGTLAALAGAARAEAPPVVAVKSGEEGQGILMTRLGRCLAVVPAHVMGDSTTATLTGTDDHDPDGTGLLLGIDKATDIATLEVSGGLARHCGVDFIAPASSASLHARGDAILTFVPPGGAGVAHLPLVTLDVGPDELVVKSTDRHQIAQTFSGSLVTVDDEPAGMLLSVQASVGHAIRYERILPLVRAMADAAPARTATAATARRPGDTGNLAAAAAGARVLRWSAPPPRPEASALNLIDPNAAARWQVPLRSGKADADIELSGHAVRAVSHVDCDLAGIPASQRPGALEILVSPDGDGWALAGRAPIAPDTAAVAVEFPSRRARYVRVQLRGTEASADGTIVSIGSVAVR